ncbi:V-type ATP synthase subunit D [Sediminispirochaeta smaragdinae]|jgi:V/A-type H+-transporting ATPase subunit D|uniref:V-type ATPase, D subunit n=1 Tax=Sediminispirochaeta smaragdinae (strain DSM 11293 / JCM 15392 / SEBR 4228) TaxID=573413 RepID=E1R3E0_SEDSS|nr:V-type ATP synthase subunit D [Sediminispirochaeta smaragdinae]ADK81571.1 V-type ATPase, D subunit [Sediminispirochaeta smaragdinae DSM 11293]
MAAVKLTKNEQKKQKDALKRYQRYLPTLMLKKQQLQMVIRQVEQKIRDIEAKQKQLRDDLASWIAVFGEDVGIGELVRVKAVDREMGNIAGVDIPVFRKLILDTIPYDLFEKPLWVDKGVVTLKEISSLDAEIEILRQQADLLGEELRITTQRVNLFEKVKIPETKKNIRKIQIYLSDQQTASVVRGKIAKNKIVRVS